MVLTVQVLTAEVDHKDLFVQAVGKNLMVDRADLKVDRTSLGVNRADLGVSRAAVGVDKAAHCRA